MEMSSILCEDAEQKSAPDKYNDNKVRDPEKENEFYR